VPILLEGTRWLRVRVSPPELSSLFVLVCGGRSSTSPSTAHSPRAPGAISFLTSRNRDDVAATREGNEGPGEQCVALFGSVFAAHHHGR
jgi:hypothetical protein